MKVKLDLAIALKLFHMLNKHLACEKQYDYFSPTSTTLGRFFQAAASTTLAKKNGHLDYA